jgi:hypothetical protein
MFKAPPVGFQLPLLSPLQGNVRVDPTVVEPDENHPALLPEKPLAEARLADHGGERVEENLVAGIVIRDSNVPNLPSHDAPVLTMTSVIVPVQTNP